MLDWRGSDARPTEERKPTLERTKINQDQNEWILVTKNKRHRMPNRRHRMPGNQETTLMKKWRDSIKTKREAMTAQRNEKVIDRRAKSVRGKG